MNRKTSGFEPSSPRSRAAFAVAAVVMTLAIGEVIDALARGAGTAAPLTVQNATIVVAKAMTVQPQGDR